MGPIRACGGYGYTHPLSYSPKKKNQKSVTVTGFM